MARITIRRFRASDQAAARALIEAGLGEHFGHIDRDANPDLIDMRASYCGGTGAFFIAASEGRIVGTIGLVVESGRGRLVRLGVARAHRRRGVATALLGRALEFARREGCSELVVHTQPEWPDATGFYRAHGFEPCGRDAIDVHLRRAIERSPRSVRRAAPRA